MSEGYYTVFYTSGNFSGYNIINVRKFAGNATYLEQLLINLDNEKISSRVCRGGTWRNWHNITYNADLNSKIQQVKFTMPSSANDAYNIALSTLGVKYTDISKVILAGIIVRNATNNLFYQLPNGLGDYTCAGIQYLHMRIKLKQSDVEFYGRQEGIATFIVM